MRKLVASVFVSLDGVMQSPGAPEEDTSGGFALGGWMGGHGDASMDLAEAGFDGRGRELVLGRRTYELFAAHWPFQPADDPIAVTFNAARKHVASRTLPSLGWRNATLLPGDAVAALLALKREAGPDLQVIGSGGLVGTLQRAGVIDEYHLWTFPVVLGRGKRFFGDAARPETLRLLRARVSGTGVVMATYVPAGAVRTTSLATVAPSAAEFDRRRRAAEGTW